MKKTDIIENVTKMIKSSAYKARIHDELIFRFNKNESMLRYEHDILLGKAFAAMEILTSITGKSSEYIYDLAVEEAVQDIKKSDYDFIHLLWLGGYNGHDYYRSYKKLEKDDE